MIPTRESVASRITYSRRTGSTVLLSQRWGLLNEAEEKVRLIRFFLLCFHLQSDTIPSISPVSIDYNVVNKVRVLEYNSEIVLIKNLILPVIAHPAYWTS